MSTNIHKTGIPPFSVSRTADWLAPAGLIVLSLVPAAAGAVRLVGLIGGAEITPGNARFFADPLPVVLHILSASVYLVLGALQFSRGIRRRRPDWHRGAGLLLIPLGLVAALSGLWLTQFYPPVDYDGPSRCEKTAVSGHSRHSPLKNVCGTG